MSSRARIAFLQSGAHPAAMHTASSYTIWKTSSPYKTYVFNDTEVADNRRIQCFVGNEA